MIQHRIILQFLIALLGLHRDRARTKERGASAVEWVVIAAIVVAIVIAVGFTLRSAITGRANEIGSEIENS